MSITFSLNGRPCRFHDDPMTPLIDVLRDRSFLTGAKAVCREGFCGACTIHIDGAPQMACLKPVALVDGREVTTIEGLGNGREPLHPLQAAFLKADVVQCGMCFPGMVMSLSAFVRDRPEADRNAIKSAMTGNICRCTGYELIIDAVVDHLSQTGISTQECADG
ncbi:(2Fe-2S)-binding protein [Aureimonas altamirensis]|uniref:(2Fe-2S)-binding protein n=1 Tax=Aureimonas altamirensis TaxID=370622 RepID=UPI001E417C7F|nr:(2Fe-2S)-binding protein [Aureimonas altamirensis]UHD43858.1 (2Fe-2S)-binding protein [Aureimonas altamirensis]